ncbi:MAG: [Fe-Fe] hydrogenase large subunit C-terminal domain-containing protein, partial [Armatimonadota bacterium]
LTIMEEAAEFVERFTNDGTLPIITSCCPGWIKYAEHFHPDLLHHLSTAKSPMSMHGSVVKSYWAEKMDIDPESIYSVAIMPCTAKKFEAEREELGAGGMAAVDCVLTTREFAWVMKHMGIDFASLPEEEPDSPLGESTGAAAIFGTTGGVTEAALRTAYWMVFDEDLPADAVEFEQVRGMDGLRFAEIPFGESTVRIALAYGLGAANRILDRVEQGEDAVDIIEVMACPGGCIGGGGQPFPGEGEMPLDEETLKLRAQALYDLDGARELRCSHHNPDIQAIYEEYLEAPNSHRAHELLHTYYYPRVPLGIRPQEAQV